LRAPKISALRLVSAMKECYQPLPKPDSLTPANHLDPVRTRHCR
jgi:hypothetical protein